MRGGVGLYLVGSLVLVGVVGCGRSWFEEREPWRREAELACLKSGAVRQGAAVAPMRPIEGPGVCGADFPLKVAALGQSSIIGFADNLRPPADIPQRLALPPAMRALPPRSPYGDLRPATPAPVYAPPGARPGLPLSIRPPGVDPPEDDDESDDEADDANAPRWNDPPSRQHPPEQRPTYRPLPPLGPSRAPAPRLAASEAVVTPPATLACPMVSALDQWVADAVQPAAQRWFGQPVAEIRQISAYSCRSMNNQRGARISEHAFGNALDVAAFVLADGRTVTVKDGWRGRPAEQGFLRDVHAAACEQFTTVLGPGSNMFHYDHFHFDLMRRASGQRICNPAAIPGEVVAGRRGHPLVTGSVGTRPRKAPLGFAPGGASEARARLPRAVPGAD